MNTSVALVPLYQFELFRPFTLLVHFVSERAGGVSQGELGSLNLSYRVGEDPENVRENRRRLAAQLDIQPHQLFFPSQTHSYNVQRVDTTTRPEQLANTDALITNTSDCCICVMSADCVPILLYDPIAKAIGAVHAGWRGTVGHILTATIHAMQREFGTQPQNIQAGIGPSICPDVYQVGPEVIKEVEQAFGTTEGLIDRLDADGQGYFNLWEANRRQLIQLGVPEKAIEVAGICTYRNSERFFSARKSENKAGRFAAGIMLRSTV